MGRFGNIIWIHPHSFLKITFTCSIDWVMGKIEPRHGPSTNICCQLFLSARLHVSWGKTMAYRGVPRSDCFGNLRYVWGNDEIAGENSFSPKRSKKHQLVTSSKRERGLRVHDSSHASRFGEAKGEGYDEPHWLTFKWCLISYWYRYQLYCFIDMQWYAILQGWVSWCPCGCWKGSGEHFPDQTTRTNLLRCRASTFWYWYL